MFSWLAFKVKRWFQARKVRPDMSHPFLGLPKQANFEKKRPELDFNSVNQALFFLISHLAQEQWSGRLEGYLQRHQQRSRRAEAGDSDASQQGELIRGVFTGSGSGCDHDLQVVVFTTGLFEAATCSGFLDSTSLKLVCLEGHVGDVRMSLCFCPATGQKQRMSAGSRPSVPT